MDKLFGIPADDIYWRFKAGRSVRRITPLELRQKANSLIKSPVFFLSTGRCGTQWMSVLLESSKNSFVLHNPKPALDIQSKTVFNTLKNNSITESETELIKEIFWAGREQFLRYSYKTNKRYIETNNYITFFAPVLIKIFPDAKFIHLYRNPAEFVRSVLRRNYYSENNSDDTKRIEHNDLNTWEKYSRIQKTAWLWNETNMFIENFKKEYPDKICSFNFNNLNLDNVNAMLEFLKIEIPEKKISVLFNKKVNVQKSGHVETYDKWDIESREQLKGICGELAEKYNYSI